MLTRLGCFLGAAQVHYHSPRIQLSPKTLIALLVPGPEPVADAKGLDSGFS